MVRRRRKTQIQDAFDAIAGFRDLADETFERLTGKPIADWLKQFGQQPRDLPGGKPAAPQQEQGMPLADAYAIMGLPLTASFEEVKRNYRRLAVIFHPDKQGGYEDAMKLLNIAYDAIKKGR